LRAGSVTEGPTAANTEFFACTASGFALAAEIVVHGTIAVVVFAVADFVGAFGSGTAFPLAAFAEDDTGATIVFAAFGQSIVDQAVAIVVYGVTDLGRFGAGLCGTDHIRAGGVADPAGCAFTGTEARLADGSFAGELLIDGTVTVVVLTVAFFKDGHDLLFADVPTLVAAGGDAASTGTFALGAVGAGVAFFLNGEVGADFVVHLAVTVVVFAIAEFDLRAAFGHGADNAGTVSFADVIAATSTTTATYSAGCSFLDEIFVHLTITVVVLFVAEFFLRSFGLSRTGKAATVGFATKHTGVLTLASTHGTGLTFLRPVFVYESVTIVVSSITTLRRRGAGGRRTSHVGLVRCTDKLTCRLAITESSRTGAAESRDKIFVYEAVTVVVFSIAKLVARRQGWRRTLQSAAIYFTTPCPLVGTLAFAGGTGLSFVAKVFVHKAVTVIVTTITKLTRGCACFGGTLNAGAVGSTGVFAGALAVSEAGGTGLAKLSKVFVYAAVTIVVQTITDFGAWLTCGNRTTNRSLV
jgi:hypothetical protein